MHRAAFSFAVARFLAQQFGEHPVERCSFCETVAVSPMGARDVILGRQHLADTNGDGFFTYIKVGQAGHQRAYIEIVHLLFEQSDPDHLPIHPDVLFDFGLRMGL